MMPFMRNIGESIRFLIVGGIGFLTSFVLTFILTEYAGWWYFASFVASQAVGWALVFTLNTFFTFSESYRGDLLARFGVFILAYLGAFVVNACVVLISTEVFGIHYLFSIAIGTVVVVGVNFFISKHVIFFREGTHPLIARTVSLVQEHWAALALALVAAVITLTPYVLLWNDPQFQGIEMMMLDAENHYLARIAEVSEGHWMTGNTFLPEKNMPFATPPLGEIIVALFGKMFAMEPARAAIVSKPVSIFAITLLIYALSFAFSRSRNASLLAAGITVLGYNLVAFSPAPLLDLLRGSPSGGPFIFFSRLVNPSISGIFLFATLFLLFREFFSRERARWWMAVLVGGLVGVSLYITPFTYSFLGLVVFLSWVWFLVRRERERTISLFIAGCVGLLFSIPFLLNYMELVALPGYENLTRFLGLVERREFVLGLLLPLIAFATAFFWPKKFPKEGRLFLLIVFAALFLVLNQQLITGNYLQPGHYHWYITKPLAGILAGLLLGSIIERWVAVRFRPALVALLLAILAYNSMGFLAPWYAGTREAAYAAQENSPLVAYLNTIVEPQVVWASVETSDYIPIYTAHDAPNSVNTGSYPIPPVFFESRLFLEYRLRGVTPTEFEETIRREAHYVGDRLWGLWLRELTGDSAAISEEEFARLVKGYTAFYARSWDDVFDMLGITLVVARLEEESLYSGISHLRERTRVGGFVVFERF